MNDSTTDKIISVEQSDIISLVHQTGFTKTELITKNTLYLNKLWMNKEKFNRAGFEPVTSRVDVPALYQLS